MVRLAVVVGAIAVIVVWLQTRAPEPKVLPPTPAALCSSTDRHTESVIRVLDDGQVEVTPCAE